MEDHTRSFLEQSTFGPSMAPTAGLAFNSDGDGGGGAGDDGHDNPDDGDDGGDDGGGSMSRAELLEDRLKAKDAKLERMESKLEKLEQDDDGPEADDGADDGEAKVPASKLQELEQKLEREREKRKEIEQKRRQDRIDQKLEKKFLDAGGKNYETYGQLVPREGIELVDGEIVGAAQAIESLKEQAPEVFQQGDAGEADDDTPPSNTSATGSGGSKPSDRNAGDGSPESERELGRQEAQQATPSKSNNRQI